MESEDEHDIEKEEIEQMEKEREQVEAEIEQMEKEHAKDILEMELEDVEDELEENEEIPHLPARFGWISSSSDDDDDLKAIQTENVEKRKQGLGKLIEMLGDMVEISRIGFDDILKSLMISLDSEGLMVLQSILTLTSQPQLTEAQVRQLMPKLDLILMEGKINETDQMLHCLSIIVHSNFNLLGRYKLLVAKSVAYCWRQMQLYDEMVQWLEKIIKKDHCDAEDKVTVSALKQKSSLLFCLVILGIVENCSAMDQVILGELKNLNREEFAKEWQKLEVAGYSAMQHLVTYMLTASLSFCQFHQVSGKSISEIAFLSAPNGVWQDLEFEFNCILDGCDMVKITSVLFALEKILSCCLTEGSLVLRREIQKFFLFILHWVGRNTAAGETIKTKIQCRPDYVRSRDTRAAILQKLEENRSYPKISESIDLLNKEDKMKVNPNSPFPFPKSVPGQPH
ncbi:hypothetical protein QUC31_010034 [Theobroma cacao]|nr:hypothetical protein QQP08_015868 [Theobroma cacao]